MFASAISPFRPAGLAQRLAPFVVAGAFGLLLLQGTDVTSLGPVLGVVLALGVLTTASLVHPAWQRAPRWTHALPLLLCLVAVTWPRSRADWAFIGPVDGVMSLALLGALWVPWHRLPRPWHAAPSLAVAAGLLVLHQGLGVGPLAMFPFATLVLLWIALYHTPRELAAGAVLVLLAFFLPVPHGSAFLPGLKEGLSYASLSLLIAVSGAQLAARMRTQAADAEAIHLVSRSIISADPLDARVAICDAARDIAGASSAVLYEMDESGVLQVSAVAGPPGALPAPALAGTAPADAVASLEPVFRATGVATAGGTRAQLAQPVLRAGEPVGVLSLEWTRALQAVPERTLVAMELLVTEAALAMQQADYLGRLAASREQLEAMAATDPLTGLANRREFDRFARGLPRQRYALLAIDVDNLKTINDTFGHEAGDEALRGVARILTDSVRAGDRAARMGGDEFAAILPGASAADAASVAERMRLAVHSLALTKGAMRASIGCVTAAAGVSLQESWRVADEALYAAKIAGRDRVVTVPIAHGEAKASVRSGRRILEAQLTDVIASGSVDCVYQPIVSLRDGEVMAYEALARVDESVVPDTDAETLFAAARRVGSERDLDWLCRRRALDGTRALAGHLALFMNVCLPTLLDPLHDVDQMELLLEWAGRAPAEVVLEVSEHEKVRDLDRLRTVLSDYRAAGFRFCLDDAGEGHSTFDVMAAMAPEFIKISAGYTRGSRQPGGRAVLAATVGLAGASGADVILEGVQSEAEARAALELGIPFGQGFGLGAPVAQPLGA